MIEKCGVFPSTQRTVLETLLNYFSCLRIYNFSCQFSFKLRNKTQFCERDPEATKGVTETPGHYIQLIRQLIFLSFSRVYHFTRMPKAHKDVFCQAKLFLKGIGKKQKKTKKKERKNYRTLGEENRPQIFVLLYWSSAINTATFALRDLMFWVSKHSTVPSQLLLSDHHPTMSAIAWSPKHTRTVIVPSVISFLKSLLILFTLFFHEGQIVACVQLQESITGRHKREKQNAQESHEKNQWVRLQVQKS